MPDPRCQFLKHFVKGKDDKKTEYRAVTIGVFVYAVMNIVIEFVMGTITLLIAGSGVNAALLGALTSIPATVINAAFMVGVVLLIYRPIGRIYKSTSISRRICDFQISSHMVS